MPSLIMTSERGQAMLSWLPSFYANIYEMQALLQAQGTEVERIKDDIVSNVNQSAVGSAEAWGLARWERDIGILTEDGKPKEQRIAHIRARLRGVGTATVNNVQALAESFQNGNIQVLQVPEQYKVIIKFVSQNGIPSNIEDMKQALRAFIPAHLAIEYQYKYLLWSDWDGYNITWEALDALNLTWSDWEIYEP